MIDKCFVAIIASQDGPRAALGPWLGTKGRVVSLTWPAPLHWPRALSTPWRAQKSAGGRTTRSRRPSGGLRRWGGLPKPTYHAPRAHARNRQCRKVAPARGAHRPGLGPVGELSKAARRSVVALLVAAGAANAMVPLATSRQVHARARAALAQSCRYKCMYVQAPVLHDAGWGQGLMRATQHNVQRVANTYPHACACLCMYACSGGSDCKRTRAGRHVRSRTAQSLVGSSGASIS